MQVMSTRDYVMLDGAPAFKPHVRYVMPDEMAATWQGVKGVRWNVSGIGNYERRYGGQDLNNKTLCISRMHGMGDQLIVTALPKYLKHLWPKAQITVYSIESYASPVWQANRNITGGRIVPLPIELDALRKYDYHLLFDGMIESNREWDQGNAYDDMFAFAGLRDVADKWKRPDLHTAERDDELARSLEWVGQDPYIVVALSTSSPIRNWPFGKIRRFVELVLEEQPSWRVAVVGTTSGMGEDVEEIEHPRVEWLVDRVPDIRQHFPLIENAGCVVGPDTGFLHVAAAYNVPIVGLYGPFSWDSRAKYYPGRKIEHPELCPHAPCWQHGMEIPRRKCRRARGYTDEMVNCACIEAIEPEEVLSCMYEVAHGSD